MGLDIGDFKSVEKTHDVKSSIHIAFEITDVEQYIIHRLTFLDDVKEKNQNFKNCARD